MKSKLTVEKVTKKFDGLVALHQVSLELEQGAILGLIGPNGSGKSTLINVVSGVLQPNQGKVELDQVDITGWKPHQIVAQGLVRNFQTAKLFGSLTVMENLLTGVSASGSGNVDQQAQELLERFGLQNWAGDVAGTLAYGLQRRLEIARSVGLRPKILLLDEPAAGLNEEESEELLEIITELRADNGLGCGILIVEHDLGMIMRLCDRVHVLNEGRTLAEGEPETIRQNPQVIEAYIGKRHAMEGTSPR